MSQDVKKTYASRCYTAVLTIKYLFCAFSSHSIESKLDCENSAVMLLQLRGCLEVYLLFLLRSFGQGPFL